MANNAAYFSCLLYTPPEGEERSDCEGEPHTGPKTTLFSPVPKLSYLLPAHLTGFLCCFFPLRDSEIAACSIASVTYLSFLGWLDMLVQVQPQQN